MLIRSIWKVNGCFGDAQMTSFRHVGQCSLRIKPKYIWKQINSLKWLAINLKAIKFNEKMAKIYYVQHEWKQKLCVFQRESSKDSWVLIKSSDINYSLHTVYIQGTWTEQLHRMRVMRLMFWIVIEFKWMPCIFHSPVDFHKK